MLLSFWSGLLTSSSHVLSGPDHLAAITPLGLHSTSKSYRVGLSWGAGHLIGIGLIATLYILFSDLIPVDHIANYSEQAVGLFLILVGLWSLRQRETKSHSNKNLLSTSFSVGVVHGFAGVAHFILLIPVLSSNSTLETILYLIGFIGGTLGAMTLFAYLLGLIYKRGAIAKESGVKKIQRAGAIFAIVVGCYWIYLSI